ncbi:MAG: SRPBCC family protein [Pseudomonadota bacterium]
MKFKTSEDIDAPLDVVWAEFTTFDTLEHEARGRGAEITRLGNWTEPAAGVEWRGSVTVRGKRRAISSRIARFEPNDVCVVESRIGGMRSHYEISFIALSKTVTRVAVVLDLSADTLTARLILQTMKLARGRVLQRLQGVLARQGNAAEAVYRRRQA